MKKMVAVGLVGLAVGLGMPGVLAQTPQAEVQKWEQFCEEEDFGTIRKGLKGLNATTAAHGKDGYQLLGSTLIRGTLLHCYRRPMQ